MPSPTERPAGLLAEVLVTAPREGDAPRRPREWERYFAEDRHVPNQAALN